MAIIHRNVASLASVAVGFAFWLGAQSPARAKPTVVVRPDGMGAFYDAALTPGVSIVMTAGDYTLVAGRPIVLAEGTDLLGPAPAVTALADGTLVPITDVVPGAPVARILGAGLTADHTDDPQGAVIALGKNILTDVIVAKSTGDAAFVLEGDFEVTRCAALDGKNRGFEVVHFMGKGVDMRGRRSRGNLRHSLARGSKNDNPTGAFHAAGLVIKNESEKDLPTLTDSHWIVTTEGCQWYGNRVGASGENVVNANHNSITLVSHGDRWLYNGTATWFHGALGGADDNRFSITIADGTIAGNSCDPFANAGPACGGLFASASWQPWASRADHDNELDVTLMNISFVTPTTRDPLLTSWLREKGIEDRANRQNGSYMLMYGVAFHVRVDLAAMGDLAEFLFDDPSSYKRSTGNVTRIHLSDCTASRDDLGRQPSTVILWNASRAWTSETKTPDWPQWLSAYNGEELDWGDSVRVDGSPTSFEAANPGFSAAEPSFYVFEDPR